MYFFQAPRLKLMISRRMRPKIKIVTDGDVKHKRTERGYVVDVDEGGYVFRIAYNCNILLRVGYL